MCGIYACVAKNSSKVVDFQKILEILSLRGKDERGCVFGIDDDFLMAQSRLAISGGLGVAAQPVLLSDGSYFCFNGEIYNWKKLAVSTSMSSEHAESLYQYGGDTLILKHCLESIGLQPTFALMDGMFSLLVYDSSSATTFFGRDRFGIKPLFYLVDGVDFHVGSDPRTVDRPLSTDELVNVFLSRSTASTGYPLHEDWREVDPGSLYRKTGSAPVEKVLDINKDLKSGKVFDSKRRFNNVNKEALFKDEICRIIDQAYPKQRDAVVLLSGGIDSSLILSILSQEFDYRPSAISIGFEDTIFDESERAAEICKHLSIDHTIIRLNQEDLVNAFYSQKDIYPTPFGDSSALANINLFKHVGTIAKVAIGGDGGDEMFSGYRRYSQLQLIQRYKWMLSALFLIPERQRSQIIDRCRRWLSSNVNLLRKLDLIEKLERFHGDLSSFGLHQAVLGSGLRRENIFANEYVKDEILNGMRGYEKNLFRELGESLDTGVLQSFDLLNYVPFDLAVKVDWPSMYYGVEMRVPFLQTQTLDLASRFFPMTARAPGRKVMLRALLRNYLPQSIVDGPKMGFGVPLDSLVKGPLARHVLHIGKEFVEQRIFDQQRFENLLLRISRNYMIPSSFLYNLAVLDLYRNK